MQMWHLLAHTVNQHYGLSMCAGERTENSDQLDRSKQGIHMGEVDSRAGQL